MTSSTAYSTVPSMATNIMKGNDVDQAEKIRENRLRRMAQRQGYTLSKSKRRDPRAYDYGVYWIVDESSGGVVAGDSTVGMTLDDVEAWLTGERE